MKTRAKRVLLVMWNDCLSQVRIFGSSNIIACHVFRHALDIREHYERKLERANNLYMELSAIMLQLEVREKELMKYVNKYSIN